jgi:transmembrane sensor
MSTGKPPTEAPEQIASTWAVRRAAGLTPEMHAEFERWLAEDPLHYAAFAEADLALWVLSAPRSTGERAQLRDEIAAWEEARLTQRRSRRHWLAVSALGMAAAVMLLVTFLPRERPQPAAAAPVGTMTRRPLMQRLPDRSLIELNANTEIAVEFTHTQRLVRLIRGEGHFTVAKDPARPFIVSVGRVKVRAVGTQFNVRFKPDTIDVLTTEGRVRVFDEAAASPAAREADVTAGHRTSVPLIVVPSVPPELAVSSASPAEIERALVWRQMRFELSNATLEQAVAWFNERSQTQFAIGDAHLRNLRISGIYWADNPDQFAELVGVSLDVNVVRESQDQIVFRKR